VACYRVLPPILAAIEQRAAAPRDLMSSAPEVATPTPKIPGAR